ncbi:MAG: putative Ig domain-containing protein, partial [Verrucomicrobiota bacterium]
SIPMLLLLGGLSIGVPPQVRGQSSTYYFALNPIPINPTNAAAGIPLTLAISNTETVNFPLGDPVVFFPPPNPPTNWPGDATITSDGHFSWTPDTSLAGTSTNFTVWAYEAYHITSNSVSFIVNVLSSVTPSNAPYLAPISDYTIAENTLLTFKATATNTDGSTNPLSFTLDANSLADGASIDPNTGVFTWTPAEGQAGVVYSMNVIVTEAVTLLSAAQPFTVDVLLTNDCPQYGDILMAVTNGGTVMLTNCPTLVVSDTIIIATNVTILAETNVLLTGSSQVRLFIVQPGGSLTLSNLTLQGGSSDRGGAIYNNGGTVVLNNCVVAGNSAVGANGSNGTDGNSDPNYGKYGSGASDGQPGVGGAIYNLGALIATNNCQFTNNTAIGGSGGSGGNGGSGGYYGGNGGNGGNGALAYGGAIYSGAGSSLSLNNCTFSANTVTGGSGGSGGTNGAGAFSGYPGTGGAGAEGSGAAVYSVNSAVMLTNTFSGNTAQGGSSAAAGEAGGGYGVNGAPGGNSFGGGVCLLGGGQLISCVFSNDAVTGGNGGNGGSGNYIGGNGGNGGNAVGGCLYNLAGATVVNCAFSGCGAVGGANGVAGGGPFTGTPGQPGSSGTNASTTITATNTVVTEGLPGVALPPVMGPGNNPAPDSSLASATGSANNAQPQAGPLADAGGPAQATTLLASSATGSTISPNAGPPGAGPPGIPPGIPPAPPGPGVDPRALRRKPFAPVVAPPGTVAPVSPTNAVTPLPAAADSALEEPLPQGMIDFRSADLFCARGTAAPGHD